MREFIIFICLVVCCNAAPSTTQQQSSAEHKKYTVIPLSRPSPINPDIPSDPKPAEKILKITDPKEIAKYKREIQDDRYDHISYFAPTVAPDTEVKKENSQEIEDQHSVQVNLQHHRQKREEAGLHILDANKPESAPAATPRPPLYHNVPASVSAAAAAASSTLQKRQVDPHLIGASTVGALPPFYNDDEEKKAAQDADVEHENLTDEPDTEKGLEADGHLETEIARAPESIFTKRDIPVPLVPKYQNPATYQNGAVDRKTDKSGESDESDQDSREKKPAVPTQNMPSVEQKVSPYHQQFSTQALSAEESHVVEASTSEKSSTGTDNPAAEQDTSKTATTTTTTTEHKPSEPAVEAPEAVSNAKPLEEQLRAVKSTKIIAYEPFPNAKLPAIKHPLSVGELFSGSKQ